jgi:hypothetical protein
MGQTDGNPGAEPVNEEVITVMLIDGPFMGHHNAYPLYWPAPEEIVAFTVDGKVAITMPTNFYQARELSPDATRYRKDTESKLPEIPKGIGLLRGASYKVV